MARNSADDPAAAATSLDGIISAIEEQARPCIRLRHAKQRKIHTKIGGQPEMSGRFDWPFWNGDALSFVAQLELAELGGGSILDGLPDQGRLFFFYDSEQRAWGFDPKDKGAWSVLFDTSIGIAAPLQPPASLPPHGRFRELTLEAFPAKSHPSTDRIGVGFGELTTEEWDEVEDRYRPSSPIHQIGGYPTPVQGDDMELECQLASNGIYVGNPDGYRSPEARALQSGAEDWLLLLQVDNDDGAGMMWGDVGMLYFWIRRQDLANRDFSNVWMILQCC
jgi:uncharacterized protein YwqG